VIVTTGDELLVARTARAVALRVAVLVGLAMSVLVGVVVLVVARQQDAATDSMLRHAVVTVDDVGDPPPGSWVVIATGSAVEISPGLPAEAKPSLTALRAEAGRALQLRTVRAGELQLRVVTARTSSGTVQVVLDRRPLLADRGRLERAMAVALAAGLVFAALLGAVAGRRAVRPLAEALGLQRSFVADASHELRTPLTLLSTRAQVLKRDLAGTGLSQGLLNDADGVVHDIQRLGHVVEDLLVAADPRGEDLSNPLDLIGVVDGVIESALAHAAARGVELVPLFPTGALSIQVAGSAAALRRAVLALVDNAIDHTPSGGRVTVGLRVEGGQARLAVTDTGPGVSPANASTVLRRFHSGGHRAGRNHYGLGLALTNDVANRHGGRLRLLPSETGSTFELSLPVRR
jgi:signal transduction histidine kinase